MHTDIDEFPVLGPLAERDAATANEKLLTEVLAPYEKPDIVSVVFYQFLFGTMNETVDALCDKVNHTFRFERQLWREPAEKGKQMKPVVRVENCFCVNIHSTTTPWVINPIFPQEEVRLYHYWFGPRGREAKYNEVFDDRMLRYVPNVRKGIEARRKGERFVVPPAEVPPPPPPPPPPVAANKSTRLEPLEM